MSDQNQYPGAPNQQPEPQQSGQQQQQPQQPAYQQPGYPQQPAYPQVPKTNTLAIVSLISSFFVGLVGIITGHMALGQIKRTGEQGRGMALAGTIIGYVMTAFVLLAVVITLISLAFGAAIFGLVFTAASGIDDLPDTPSITSPTTEPAPAESGTEGAVNFDEGYIFVGTGPVVVDYFFDPMCPYCGEFDTTNGALLADAARSDAITLRLHTLNFLDPVSQGTDYSTRAGAALSCVAQLEPEKTTDYLNELFVQQPAEQSAGLNDDELAGLIPGLRDETLSCITVEQPLLDWVRDSADATLSGETTELLGLPAVSGTPTVFVDGVAYSGALDDAAAFEAFLGVK